MQIPNFIWVMIGVVTLTIVTVSIAYFFNIEASEYIPYLLWFIGLAFFYIILAPEQKSVFVTN